MSLWGAEPPVGHFTDREGYVGRIRQAAEADRDSPAVLVLSGRSGMGKSALLRQSAAKLRDLLTDCLAVDFRPLRHKGGVSVSDALAGALSDLGLERAWIPEDLPGRRRRYLAMTEGKRLLVLLDNVDDVACIASFVPNSAHAVVLVTSELAFDDLYEQDVTVLPVLGLDEGHGAELLAKVCGGDRELGEPEAVGRLVRFCGGSPLGLRIAAGQLRTRLELSVAELEADLRAASGSASRGARRMTEGLKHAYETLSPSAARLYRALGVLPGAVQPERILSAALGGSNRDGLDELSRAYLVDRDGDDYRLPELVRLHAQGVANTDEDVDEAESMLRRAVRAWLEDAAEADLAVQRGRLRVGEAPENRAPRGLSKQDALKWFHDRHESLVSVVRLAAELRLHAVVWQLFEAMWPFYSNGVFFESWEATGKLAVEAAERDENERAEARVRCLLSRAFVELGRFGEADAQLLRAREAAGRSGDQALYASVLDFVGKSLYQQGKFGEALAVYRESLELHERIGDQRGIALQAQFVGRCLGELRDVEGALAALDRAQRLIVEHGNGDLRTESRIALSRGKVLKELGDRDAEAVDSLHDAVELADRLGASALVDEPVRLLIELAHQHGDVHAERRYLQRAQDLHARARSPHAEELRLRLAALPGNGSDSA